MSFSLFSNAARSDDSALAAVIARLRAEHDATESEARRGMLLHELATLEAASQNESQAARDLLSAVNARPEFHEPLERLVVLMEQRKSEKNLAKLLDRLAKAAETPEETSRSLVGLAEFLEDSAEDRDGALAALRDATEAKPDDADAWLFLEHFAAGDGDGDLRERCLAARAGLATDPAWAALLLIDLAKLRLEAGKPDEALEALELALGKNGPAQLDAFEALERFGREQSRTDLVIRALEGRAELLDLARSGSAEPAAAGVPAALRTGAHAADAWLCATELHESAGNTERAVALLEKARAALPEDPAVSAASLRTLSVAGDVSGAATVARAEIEHGTKGAAAAALWMKVTEAAAARGDAATAIAALHSALEEDVQCIPARTLELHLLGGMDAALLAQALTATAQQIATPKLAGELHLLAADTWARSAGNAQAAKESLARAAEAAVPAEVVARVARALAAATANAEWLDEATRALVAAGPPESECVGLWFEIGRARLRAGNRAGAVEAFRAARALPSGTWLGSAVLGYAMGAGDAASGEGRAAAEALEGLSQRAEQPAEARALDIAAAVRWNLLGAPDEATRVLAKLHGQDATDLVSALALSGALARQGNPRGASSTLAAAAERTEDPSVRAALALEAGIVRWASGDRDGAVAAFESVASTSPAASGLLAWALRAASPNDLSSRRRALDASADEDRALVALERWGIESGEGGDPSLLAGCVEGVSAQGALDAALHLARALAPGDGEGRSESLAWMSAAGDLARTIARATEHAGTGTGPGDRATALATARAWAEADGGAASALEWFVRAKAAENLDEEIASREALATRLGGKAGTLLLGSARILQLLSGSGAPARHLPGNDLASLLVNLEISPPASDTERRAAALLSASAELDAASSPAALALAGWNLLASGNATVARRVFQKYVDQCPEDIVAWEGLRAAAELSSEPALLAEASAALGDLSSDAGQGAELWERAATLLLDELDDPVRGEAALARAVARDIGRTSAFDRLFRIVRARRDGPQLLGLIEERLTVAEDSEEIAKLYWERARALREAGDSAGALEALDNVRMLEADHVGALAMTGEIYIGEKRFDEAAESLSRLASLSDAPAPQRLMGGVAAADLYEGRLGQLDRALEVLTRLYRDGLSTLPIRERLARAALRAESWETAADVLEELMAQRETRAGRIEAARTAFGIRRDRLGSPEGAEKAVLRLLEEAPDDGEALDFVLSGQVKRPLSGMLLGVGRAATIDALTASPLDLERMIRLSRIAAQVDDAQLRQVTLGAVVALGGATEERLSELVTLDGRIARTPQIAIDDAVVAGLRDPEDRGAIAELISVLATTLAAALGPGLPALGVTKKERVRPQDGLPLRNEIAAWVGALGLGEFELYVGGRDPEGICAVATEEPAIVVGSAVRAPLSAAHRQVLARELLALKLGVTILRHRDVNDIAALVIAGCNLGGVKADAPPYAMLAEFERQLNKEIPRRVRKLLPDIAARVARENADVAAWVRAARSTLDRMAAVAVGDVSWVLAAGDAARRGKALETAEGKLSAERLLPFVLSTTFFAVREKLGMGVQ